MNVSWKADGKTRPTVLVEVPFATRRFRSEKCSLTEITFAERKLPTNAKVFSTRGAPRTLLSQILKFSLPPKSRMKIRLLMKMCLPSKCRTPISEFRSDCAINRRCAQVYHCLRRRVLVFGMRQRRMRLCRRFVELSGHIPRVLLTSHEPIFVNEGDTKFRSCRRANRWARLPGPARERTLPVPEVPRVLPRCRKHHLRERQEMTDSTFRTASADVLQSHAFMSCFEDRSRNPQPGDFQDSTGRTTTRGSVLRSSVLASCQTSRHIDLQVMEECVYERGVAIAQGVLKAGKSHTKL